MAKNTYDIDEKLEVPFNFNHLKRSLKYVKSQSLLLSVGLILNVIIIIISLFIPYYSKIILDECIPNKDLKLLIKIGIIYAVILIVSHIFSYIQARLIAVAGQRIVHTIREELFLHLQKLSFSYYDSRPHGKILVRVVNYVNNVAGFLSGGLVNLVLQLLSIVFITIFMFATNVSISLLILSGLPPLVLFICLIKGRQRRSWQSFTNKSSNMNAYLGENINGIKVTQSFTREKINISIYDRLITDMRIAWMKIIKIIQTVPMVIEILTFLITCIIYYFSTLVFHDITIGVLFAMVSYAGRFWQPIQAIGNIYNDVINTASYLERIYETLDEPVEIDDKTDVFDIGEIKGEVEFKNVNFSYEKGFLIFDNLNLKIEAGESIALVGPTGAGKTTIVNLISRFYDIDSGELLIDNKPIKDVTLKSLRKNMGIMLQDSFIFRGTIMENIRYGRLDATDEEIIAAAKAVRANDFIENFPAGYETYLSENGASLSSGQRQLISFARTMLSDPRILILDEATSAIDTQTELLLQQGINALLQNRTSFIIAHRLSTIKNCDRICYIADKGIRESGSHDELISKKGYYYDLYTAQVNEIN